MPTSNSLGTGIAAVPSRIFDSTPGAILQPQPPPCESEVRRGSAGFSAAFMVGSFGSAALAQEREHSQVDVGMA